MNIVPFKAEYFHRLNIQPSQAHTRAYITDASLAALEFTGGGVAVLEGDEVLAVGGVFPAWPGRGVAWVLNSERFCKMPLTFVRVLRKVLADAPFRRIELTITCDTPNATKFAKVLGFELEIPRMKHYGVDGSDQAQYVRFNHVG